MNSNMFFAFFDEGKMQQKGSNMEHFVLVSFCGHKELEKLNA